MFIKKGGKGVVQGEGDMVIKREWLECLDVTDFVHSVTLKLPIKFCIFDHGIISCA
jgi:hypothetical protein